MKTGFILSRNENFDYLEDRVFNSRKKREFEEFS